MEIAEVLSNELFVWLIVFDLLLAYRLLNRNISISKRKKKQTFFFPFVFDANLLFISEDEELIYPYVLTKYIIK